MQHKCKITVIKKELYTDFQEQYLADPKSGACDMFEVGQKFLLERYEDRDDFWHMLQGSFCSEAWDSISRYCYAALQGGALMRHWTNDDRLMIACCSDGTRPVVFKIERLDYQVLRFDAFPSDADPAQIKAALEAVPDVRSVDVLPERGWIEVFVDADVPDALLKEAFAAVCATPVLRID